MAQTKVLFCGEFPSSLTVSGGPTINSELFDRLANDPTLEMRGYSPLFSGELPLYSHPNMTYLPTAYLRSTSCGDLLARFSFSRALRAHLSSAWMPDIIHINSNASLALSFPGIPKILFLHGSEKSGRRMVNPFTHPYSSLCSAINIRSEKQSFQNKDIYAYFAISAASRNQLIRDYALPFSIAKRIHIAHLGYNTARFRLDTKKQSARARLCAHIGIEDKGQCILLFVGGIAAHKGQRDLIERMVRIRTIIPNAVLILVGKDAGDRSYCEFLARRSGIMQAVFFPGQCDGEVLGFYYGGADIYLSCVSETFGINQLEAMVCGLPIAAYDLGAVAELFPPEFSQYCVRSDEEFFARLGELASSTALRLSVGSALKDHASRTYSWDSCARMIASVYDDVRKARRGNPLL